MTLDQWIAGRQMRMAEVAAAIGVHLVTAYKLRSGKAKPSIRVAAAIERLTDGQVTARDFMPEPEQAA